MPNVPCERGQKWRFHELTSHVRLRCPSGKGTFTFVPAAASAQVAAHGHFTLAHDVRWGSANIPAGDYAFSFDPDQSSAVLTLSKMSAPRMGFIVLVPSTDVSKSSEASRLLLATSANGSYVTAMQLPEFGMTLHFSTPSHIVDKPIAKAAAPTSLGQ